VAHSGPSEILQLRVHRGTYLCSYACADSSPNCYALQPNNRAHYTAIDGAVCYTYSTTNFITDACALRGPEPYVC